MTATMHALCRSCGASIWWAEVEPSGKRMPVDKDPDVDGNVVVVVPASVDAPPIVRVLAQDELTVNGEPHYVSHFATCSDAAVHRRGA